MNKQEAIHQAMRLINEGRVTDAIDELDRAQFYVMVDRLVLFQDEHTAAEVHDALYDLVAREGGLP